MIKHILAVFYGMFLARRWKLSDSAEMLARDFATDYLRHKYPYYKIYSIHRKGFSVTDWDWLSLTKDNYRKYLCTADYYSIHPVNGKYSEWIDDKLTLKYLCSGTELDGYLPEYYFQIDDEGYILPLMDYESDGKAVGADKVLELLKEKKILCLKQVVGSLTIGFYRLECTEGGYRLNGEDRTQDEIKKMIEGLRNYIIIEFFKPHPKLAEVYPYTSNNIRYLFGRNRGEQKGTMLTAFIQFGTKKSCFSENYVYGGVMCFLDRDGNYTSGHCMDFGTHANKIVYTHPDTGTKLEGRIPHWDEIVDAVDKFEKHFPQFRYLGFDFLVTDRDEVKILEINSLTSLDAFQTDAPLFEKESKDFYQRLLKR